MEIMLPKLWALFQPKLVRNGNVEAVREAKAVIKKPKKMVVVVELY
jgi:hypothetical protein